MSRLPAGVEPVPHKLRLRSYRAELEKRGGRRVNADLEPDAAAALAELLEGGQHTVKEVISEALLTLARARR